MKMATMLKALMYLGIMFMHSVAFAGSSSGVVTEEGVTENGVMEEVFTKEATVVTEDGAMEVIDVLPEDEDADEVTENEDEVIEDEVFVIEAVIKKGAKGETKEKKEAVAKSVIKKSEFEDEFVMELYYSIMAGDSVVVGELLNKIEDVDTVYDNSWTVLHLATGYKDIETIQVVLKAGADVNIKDSIGQTALHIASRRGDLSIVRALLEAGADVNIRDKFGRTALHLVSGFGNKGMRYEMIAQVLVKAGVNIDIKNEFYQTALHVVARYGNIGVARVLVNNMHDIEAHNIYGETALCIAKAYQHEEVVELLMTKKPFANWDCSHKS